MSMTVDGTWKAGVWATTVWADGVWREGEPPPPPPPTGDTFTFTGRTAKRLRDKTKRGCQVIR